LGVAVGLWVAPSLCECKCVGSNPSSVTSLYLLFFIENNLSYLVGGNIISVTISANDSGNIISVAII